MNTFRVTKGKCCHCNGKGLAVAYQPLTPVTCMTVLQPETMLAISKVPRGTVAEQSVKRGLAGGEPLLLALDGMLRYAKAHKTQFDGLLCEDYVLGDEWLQVVKGLRGLLNGNGAVANEKSISTDTKDNGVCEEIFWAALGVAGFEEKDI